MRGREPRCVGGPTPTHPGRPARIVLADSKHAASGRPRRRPFRAPQTLRCHQARPDRNHHCVLVFRNVKARLGRHRRLPCALHRCHVNVVARRQQRRASRGNVLIIGADRPDGRIEQDMGRLNAIVIPRGVHARVSPTALRSPRSSRPARGPPGQRRVASRLLAEAPAPRRRRRHCRRRPAPAPASPASRTARTSRRKMIIAGQADGDEAVSSNVTLSGFVTEANGFNCTQGPSAYRTPCVTRKAGLATIRHRPVDRQGVRAPLYLNLIQRSFPKLARARPGDAAQVLGGGFVAATVYRAPARLDRGGQLSASLTRLRSSRRAPSCDCDKADERLDHPVRESPPGESQAVPEGEGRFRYKRWVARDRLIGIGCHARSPLRARWRSRSRLRRAGRAPRAPVQAASTRTDPSSCRPCRSRSGRASRRRSCCRLAPASSRRWRRATRCARARSSRSRRHAWSRSRGASASPYSYSPRLHGADRARLEPGRHVGRRRSPAVASQFQMGCGQKRPNRNHHCVLTFPNAVKPILPTDQLPCATGACFLELVVSAQRPKGKRATCS